MAQWFSEENLGSFGEFERNAGAFIEATLDRLVEEGISDTWLQERWKSICESQEDADERAFCKAAGALGIDPYACPDEEAAPVEMSSELLADDALPEFLAGCKLDEVTDALMWMDESEAALGNRVALPALPDIASDVRRYLTAGAVDERAWQAGHDAAAACRDRIGLNAERSFQDPSDIAHLFGAREFDVCGSRINGLRAEVNGAADRPRIVVACPGRPESLNFATMRAIGDYLVYSSDGRAPVNDTRSYRQAVSGIRGGDARACRDRR